jgi:LPXTG-motif cell wall-anchored protein
MKSWTVFLIAIGCLMIAVSPQLPSSSMYLVAGLVFIVLGVIILKKKKRK